MLPSKEELAQRYTNFSDQKLLEILHKEGIRPEALEAAMEELKKRNINPETVTDYVQTQETKKIVAAENATLPLPLHQKFLFFTAWFIPFFFKTAFHLNYEEDGMDLKLKQSSWYSIAGFIFLFITAFITVAFDLGNFSSIGILFGFFCLFYFIEGKINK